MKKLLATVLTLTMLLGAMGTVFAAYGYDATINNTIAVDFVQNQVDDGTGTDTMVPDEGEGYVVYNIVLKAATEEINRLNTADLTFKLNVDEIEAADGSMIKGDIAYEIIASNPEIEINKVVDANTDNDNRYEFHYKDKEDDVTTDTAAEIIIGQVKFSGYGQFDFYVDTTFNATNLVTATTIHNNIVTEFSANGTTDGTLNLDGVDGDNDADNITDELIAITTRHLDIEVAFPNIVDFNAADYQAMTVEVTGGLVDETFILGNDAETTNAGEVQYGAETSEYTVTAGKVTMSLEEEVDKDTADGNADGYVAVEVNAYTIALDLPINTNYTITVKGAGYRTGRYNVVLSEDKTVKFWNNVMDELREMEVDNEESEATVNFLAGDIVEDSNINIYDLSAVVSYFNTAADDTTSAFDYIQKEKLIANDCNLIQQAQTCLCVVEIMV